MGGHAWGIVFLAGLSIFIYVWEGLVESEILIEFY